MNSAFRPITTPRFWACFAELPMEVRRRAMKQDDLFVENPFHPSLRLKQADVF